MKTKKGFTLLEVILTLAILVIAISIPANFLIFGNKVQKLTMSEADIQASTRLISQDINNITRFATKTHTIPRSSFQHSENGVRDPITSYIGITKDGHVVIDKPGVNIGDPRIVEYVAKKQPGIEYEIIFDTVPYTKNGVTKELENILSFSIIGKKDGKEVTKIVSNIEIMNSLNIDHLGTPSDPAVALAFSMVAPGSQTWIEVSPDAYIAMVFDVSGSMDWDMNGNNINEKRIKILKDKSLKMIDRLANMDFNIYISLVPFSNNANNPTDFYNVNNDADLATIKTKINALNADGATNTGDGIRRAYYQLKKKTDPLIIPNKKRNFSQHMMILVDGATNRETNKITGRGWFLGYFVSSEVEAIEDGNTDNSVVVGNRRVVNVSENNNDYITYLGNQFIKNKTYSFEGETSPIYNSFVIGFSNNSTDHNSLQAIGVAVSGKQFEHATGSKPYIIATNADDLDFAFEQFESEVENNLWMIMRPKLLP